MKKNLNYLPLFFTVIVFSFMSCSEEDSGPAEPKKVLNFLVDGERVDFVGSDSSSSLIIAIMIDNKSLSIAADSRLSSNFFGLSVGSPFFDQPLIEATYPIGMTQDYLENNLSLFNPNNLGTSSAEYPILYRNQYAGDVLSSSQVGHITITKIDKVNRMVSGTFSGTLFRWADVQMAEKEVIEITDGNFSVPYSENSLDLDPNRDFISATVNGYHFMANERWGGDPYRSDSSGFDKIVFEKQDRNFGRIRISIPGNVNTGNSYAYITGDSSNNLGVGFFNLINLPENLESFNPDHSNRSHITIINHDKDLNKIEGTFYTEDYAIEGRTITEGYFNISYNDLVDND